MEEKIAILLGWICLFISIFPLIISIVSGKNTFKQPYIFVWLFILFSTFINLCAAYIYYFEKQDVYSISPFLAFNDVLFILLYFIVFDKSNRKVHIFIFSCLLIMNVYQYLIKNESSDFEELSLVSKLLFTISAIFTIKTIVLSKKSKNIFKNQNFLFSLAILFHNSMSLIIVPIGALWRNSFNMYPYLPLIFSNINYLITMIIFGLGFYNLSLRKII